VNAHTHGGCLMSGRHNDRARPSQATSQMGAMMSCKDEEGQEANTIGATTLSSKNQETDACVGMCGFACSSLFPCCARHRPG